MRLSFLIFAFLAVGFGETIGQVLLLREFTINFQGNELSLGIIFGSWLFTTALGSYGLGRLVDIFKPKLYHFVFTQILYFLILPAQILLARNLNYLLGLKPGEIVGILPIFYSSLILLAPLCMLNGFQFTLGCSLLAGTEEDKAPDRAVSVGRIYVAEASGSVIGGIIFTYILVHYLRPLEIAFISGLLNLVAGFILLNPRNVISRSQGRPEKQVIPTLKDRPAIFLLATIVLLSTLAVFLWLNRDLQNLHHLSRSWQWRGEEFLLDKDSYYGNIAITRRGGQTNLYESGLFLFSAPHPDVVFLEEISHFPLLSHPLPQRVLLLGGGAGGLLEEILKHPVEELGYVEVDPLLIEMVRKELKPAVFSDPRLKLIFSDGRLFIKEVAKKEQRRYDVIIMNLPPPSTLNLNRFYTRQFFQEIQTLINRSGIFAFTLPSSEAYMSPEMIRLNRCIHETLRSTFPVVKIIPGEFSIFIASTDATMEYHSSPILNPEAIKERFTVRNLETRLLTLPYLDYKLSPERAERLLAPLLKMKEAEINQDLRPAASFYQLALWNVMFYPALRRFFEWVSGLKLWWPLLPLILTGGLILLLRFMSGLRGKVRTERPSPSAVIWAVLTTGFGGMSTSMLVLLTFQTLEGHLYQKIGVLVASFMLGLVLGGTAITRALPQLKKVANTFSLIEFSILFYSLVLPFLLFLAGKLGGEVPLILLNCFTGFLVGAEFPLASSILLKRKDKIVRVAGSLYAYDLWGAILGAVLTSVFFIPLLGVRETPLVVGMAKVVSLILLRPDFQGESIFKNAPP